MLQCTSKADMEDWVRDINRLRGGRVDLASGQNLTEFPTGQDIYEGRCGCGCGQFGNYGHAMCLHYLHALLPWLQLSLTMRYFVFLCARQMLCVSQAHVILRYSGTVCVV